MAGDTEPLHDDPREQDLQEFQDVNVEEQVKELNNGDFVKKNLLVEE